MTSKHHLSPAAQRNGRSAAANSADGRREGGSDRREDATMPRLAPTVGGQLQRLVSRQIEWNLPQGESRWRWL